MYKMSGIFAKIICDYILNPEYDNLVRYLDSEQFYYKFKNKPRGYNKFNSIGLYRFFKTYNRFDHNEELWTMNKRVKWTTGYKGDDVNKYKELNCFRFNDDANMDIPGEIKSIRNYNIFPESQDVMSIHKYSNFAYIFGNRFEMIPSYRKATAKDAFKDELAHFTVDGD